MPDPEQTAAVPAPRITALNHSILNVSVVIDRFPHHLRRAVSHLLPSNSSHCGPHSSHLEVILSIAISPDGSIAIYDTPDQLGVNLARLSISQVVRRR